MTLTLNTKAGLKHSSIIAEDFHTRASVLFRLLQFLLLIMKKSRVEM